MPYLNSHAHVDYSYLCKMKNKITEYYFFLFEYDLTFNAQCSTFYQAFLKRSDKVVMNFFKPSILPKNESTIIFFNENFFRKIRIIFDIEN